MRYLRGRWLAAVATTVMLGMGLVASVPTRAQAPPPGGGNGGGSWFEDVFTSSNNYLRLFTYWRGDGVTKFNLWTEQGDPLNPADDFFIVVDNDGNFVAPWGSRLLSANRPYPEDSRPIANNATIRVFEGGEFVDLAFPGDGQAVFGPPVVWFPAFQGHYAPYLFLNGQLEVVQKVQFARDLVRIEYTILNHSGTSRRVGVRALIDAYERGADAVFLPGNQEWIHLETDFGERTGTPTRPVRGWMPEEWIVFADRPLFGRSFVAKGILTGNGATPPTRLLLGNTLNPGMYDDAAWDYDVDRPMEMRISDIGSVIYWDPVDVPARSKRTFVTYAGVGVASHGMSNAYLARQARLDLPEIDRNYTQGYIAAVQAPFALNVRNGNTDTQDFNIWAFQQNMYHEVAMPNGFAFLELPRGLRLSPNAPGQSERLNMGSLMPVGRQGDEGRGFWEVQPTGAAAGLLPVNVVFSNGFQDSTRVTRWVHVPQGNLYHLGDDWRMITFPYTFEDGDDDASVALGLPSTSFRMVRFNPLTNSYENVRRIRPGQSYWVRMLGLGNTTVRLNDARPIRLGVQDSYVTPLRTGWNQIGNPSPYSVPVRELLFLTTGGRIVSFDDAVQFGHIRQTMWWYNRVVGRYEPLTRESMIPPGQGIWVSVQGERFLVWPAPQGPDIPRQ